ncbi:acyl-CoA thioesterase domain-containing protein [Frankia sp. Cr1]|uniref:acyl-CoA thioesterase domain-containing protein n=1 Tax=Frankia sp. Cr1 TaxID=3073931 RepID=UPI002AD3AB5F|nr:acyl-CoA thioesterase domain-containing protein [Frankia sp. Cr1]
MSTGFGMDMDGADRTAGGTTHDLRGLLGFLGLSVDAEAGGGSLVAGPHLLNSGRTLWGGCGLAAAIAVTESILDRGCVWATVQYVSPIQAGACLNLQLEVGQHGRSLSQVAVRGMINDRLALLATGTFGGPTDGGPTVDGGVQFAGPPDDVPGPPDCPPRTHTSSGRSVAEAGGMLAQIEQRWARPPRSTLDGSPGSGRAILWARLNQPMVTSTASVAILADLAPAAVIDAVGRPVYTLSLDNSLRVGRLAQTDWMLVDAQVEAVIGGVAQVSARIFDENGQQIATADQSAKLLPPRTS